MALRSWMLLIVFVLPLSIQAGGTSKQMDNTWAKIVVDLFTPEMNQKALEFDKFAAVQPTTELRFDVKRLGGEGKFSIQAIQKKYGKPAKVEKYSVNEDGNIVAYQEYHYPPLSLAVPMGSDQATMIAAPKKLWTGKGILENARAALQAK